MMISRTILVIHDHFTHVHMVAQNKLIIKSRNMQEYKKAVPFYKMQCIKNDTCGAY